ncbi:MAG: hypothetical protein AB8F78_16185 [Saprospiraceae bacterium]
MVTKYLHPALLFVLAIGLAGTGFAQVGLGSDGDNKESDKKIRFNGMGRANMQQTQLDGPILDTLNGEVDRVTDGEFVLDLAINATPNKVTEVQAILRLRNELGGFFGAGQSIEVRELWARGIVADIVKYRIGDIDMVMSPYTLFNPLEEGVDNRAAIFQPQRDVISYEQFYTDQNERRLQGANVELGLNFSQVLQEANVQGFVSRVRATDFFTAPSRFVGGGSLNLISERMRDSFGIQGNVTLNAVYTWDDLTVGEATTGIRNGVNSLGYNFSLYETQALQLSLEGETGFSNLNVLEDSVSVSTERSTFLEAQLSLKLKKHNLNVSAGFIDVGPDFFSIGAQSKRIDFNRSKSFFNRVGPQNARRDPALFDIGRDRALYTFQLSDRLMDYDPRLSNVMPYGQATANRRGLQFGADWTSKDEVLDFDVRASILSELRGQGTNELKDFQLVRANGTVNFHKLAGWKNEYRMTLGTQFENTKRGGIAVELIDFSSSLIEVGLEAEVYPKLHLLAGGQFLSASGNEYLPVVRSFNDVRDFENAYIIDETETLIGAGFKYNFKEDTFLTLQYQTFNYADALAGDSDYSLNQIFVLYSMNF